MVINDGNRVRRLVTKGFPEKNLIFFLSARDTQSQHLQEYVPEKISFKSDVLISHCPMTKLVVSTQNVWVVHFLSCS